jgi:hypothetical protein
MILIGTDDGIYRWFEGAGWPVFHSLQDRSIVGLASPGPGVLVALDRGGHVFESVNNGQDWRTIPLAEGTGTPTALAAWGTPPFVVLASRPLGLFRRPVGAPIPVYKDPGFAPALIGRAWSLAGGATGLLAPKRGSVQADRATASRAGWTRLGAPSVGKPSSDKGSNGKGSNGKSGQGGEVQALAVGAGSPTPWYAAVRGAGLWRSTDLGASWRQCPGLSAEVNAIRTAPERPGSVYVATSDGCWISGDAGQTWEERSGGLDNARYLSAIEVKPGAPDVLLAGAVSKSPNDSAAAPLPGLESSLYESKDGGKTWSLVRRGNPDVLEDDMIADLRHDPAAPENVIMALASGELWVTRNAGAFWIPLSRQTRAARTLCAIA